jgi:PAS domain S-box-containing protein
MPNQFEPINYAKDKDLITSELRYRRLFETAQDGILLVDFNTGMILDVNKYLIDMLGYSKADFLKKYLWEVGVFKDIAASKSNFSILQKKRYVRFEDLPLETKTGETVDVEVVANAYQVDSTSIIQCNIRNITDRKRSEKLALDRVREIKTRDEAILNSIGDAVFACDKEGILLLFNKMAEDMTGVPAKKVIGRHYNNPINFIRESDGIPSNDFIAEAIKYKKITKMTNHVLLVRKDGRTLPVADSAAPIKDTKGNVIGCVVVFHDVTRERQIDKAKTEFVSLASHQLRTPLSTINWYSEMLLSEDVGRLTPKQHQYTKEVYHASQRMVSLVNALLNVSRLELGTFAVEPTTINIISVAKTCIKDFGPQILKKKLVVRQKYDKSIIYVKADPKLMAIIFQNFLSNSVKYTKSGGKIGLTIGKEKDTILITVSDTGIGIPKDQQKEIFGKLSRADNAKKLDPDGSGLGLYIVKEIIYYTGGKVWFKSNPKGTIFYAKLPLSGMSKKAGSKTLT